MTSRFGDAQAAVGVLSTAAAPQIVRVIKPLTDQAVVIELGYNQKYKLDLSGIVNEKITLVHVGEKLIILFDNNSTVTVHPSYDSGRSKAGSSASARTPSWMKKRSAESAPRLSIA